MGEMTRKIEVAATPDGAPACRIVPPPGGLPAVRGPDLKAAGRAGRGSARAFRFRRADGCWTGAVHGAVHGAVDKAVGMQTGFGLSVGLRLLAPVDLLARAGWLRRLVELDAGGAQLHPASLRLAAAARLTDEATFDETGFRACLVALPSSGE